MAPGFPHAPSTTTLANQNQHRRRGLPVLVVVQPWRLALRLVQPPGQRRPVGAVVQPWRLAWQLVRQLVQRRPVGAVVRPWQAVGPLVQRRAVVQPWRLALPLVVPLVQAPQKGFRPHTPRLLFPRTPTRRLRHLQALPLPPMRRPPPQAPGLQLVQRVAGLPWRRAVGQPWRLVPQLVPQLVQRPSLAGVGLARHQRSPLVGSPLGRPCCG